MEHVTEHSLVIDAAAERAYDLVADVTRWPVIFGPTVHVEHLERGADRERFRLWALVGDEIRDWTSRRTLDAQRRLVRFEQERPTPPVAAMGGEWAFEPMPGGRTEVVLRHHFTAADDVPSAVRWINEALDRNSAAELDALRRVAELGYDLADIVFSFTDSIEFDGSAADAYDFIYRAGEWPDRLPHVSRVDLRETSAGLQTLEMDTSADGATHTTRSVRVCFPAELIAYKQITTPEALLGHSGRWTFSGTASGARVTAEHTVAVDPTRAAGVLGRDAVTPAAVRDAVRAALSANSRTTLTHAKDFAARGAA